jgi:Domain of unknown function (DUF4145)
MPIEPTNWVCPFCNRAQVVTENTYDTEKALLETHLSKHGYVYVSSTSVVCANPECREITLSIDLETVEHPRNSQHRRITGVLHSWTLLPRSFAKPQPEFIPEPIQNDYYEACAIRDLSPKASATLSRRCLQGMIRDFCGIAKSRLIDEIRELKNRHDNGSAPSGVTEESIIAIDHVREIGNIGAHMEKDINVIVDVDPQEAQQLIGLTEMLFAEWYVARENRRKRLLALGITATEKVEQKKPPQPDASAEGPQGKA